MDIDQGTDTYIKCQQWDESSELENTSNLCTVYQECLIQEDFEFCVSCGLSLHIIDDDVPIETQDHAKNTLPKNLLEIKRSLINKEGVFALKAIPPGIKFGPYKGLKSVHSNIGYLWKIENGKLVNSLETESSNWMRYVNCARSVEEQNLVTFQHEGDLYYRTIKTVHKGQELLLFYGEEFAEIFSINANNNYEPVFEKKQFLKKSVFENVPRKVRCQFCKKHFTHEKYLTLHLRYCRHKNNRKLNDLNANSAKANSCNMSKLHECLKCGSKMNNEDDFKKHVQTHNSDIKVHPCWVCSKKFIKEVHLKVHLLTHAELVEKDSDSTEKEYRCPKCHYKTYQINSLSKHYQAHIYPQKDTDSAEKQFSCLSCTFKANDMTTLNIHFQREHNLKPFECAVCNKKFAHKWGLTRHLTANDGDTSFQCSYYNFVLNRKNPEQTRKKDSNKET